MYEAETGDASIKNEHIVMTEEQQKAAAFEVERQKTINETEKYSSLVNLLTREKIKVYREEIDIALLEITITELEINVGDIKSNLEKIDLNIEELHETISCISKTIEYLECQPKESVLNNLIKENKNIKTNWNRNLKEYLEAKGCDEENLKVAKFELNEKIEEKSAMEKSLNNKTNQKLTPALIRTRTDALVSVISASGEQQRYEKAGERNSSALNNHITELKSSTDGIINQTTPTKKPYQDRQKAKSEPNNLETLEKEHLKKVEESFPKQVIGTMMGSAIGALAVVGLTGAIATATAYAITGTLVLGAVIGIFSGPIGWTALAVAACIGVSIGAIMGYAITRPCFDKTSTPFKDNSSDSSGTNQALVRT